MRRSHWSFGRRIPVRALAEALERRALLSAAAVHGLLDPDDEITEAIPTGNGYTFNNVENPLDVDMFAVVVDVPRAVGFDIDSTSFWNSYLRLFDAGGNQLAFSDDDDGFTPENRITDSFILYQFAAPGTYYLGVSAFNNIAYDPVGGGADSGGESAGSYLLFIQGLSEIDTNDQIAEATPLADGTFVARIDTPNDVDMYRITTTGASVVTVDIDLPTGNLDPVMRLFGPDGTQLGIIDDLAGPVPEYSALESYMRITFPGAGTGYVGVSAMANDDYDAIGGQDNGAGGSVGAYTMVVTGISPPAEPPRVTAVYVNGTSWGPAFRQYLAFQGLGDAQRGFAVLAADQLNELPWINVNEVSITFNTNVTVERGDLVVGGVNVETYAVNAFNYHAASRTATWGLAQVITNDKVTLDLDGDAGGVTAGGTPLDGEWAQGADSFPSGDGNPGGDFRFRVHVLPGDANRNGAVAANDFSDVKRKFFSSTAAPGTGDARYSPYYDLDGNGTILANDASAVKPRFFTSVPPIDVPTFGDRRIRIDFLRDVLA